MSKNVNVFIGVLLCAVLCGTFVWLSSSGDESSWSPNDIYNEVQGTGSVGGYATTSATFSGSSNDGGVALPMSSSSMRARTSYKYAGAYSGASYAPLASSPLTYGAASGAGLYTTSSAELKSFGGGGNGGAAMGGAMRSSSSPNSLIASSPITSISPIAYSTARRGGMSSAAGDDLAMMAAENPVIAMSNAASVGMGTGFYGGYTAMDYSGSANYGQYTGMFGGGSRMGVRGRQNSGLTDSWLDWLYRYGWAFGTGTGSDETGWTYTFTYQQLLDAYNDYINNYWDSMWGPDVTKPDFDEWLTWLQNGGDNGYGYKGNWYMMAPVGDIIPLLLLALLYVLFVAIKSKSFKSLLRTERSE